MRNMLASDNYPGIDINLLPTELLSNVASTKAKTHSISSGAIAPGKARRGFGEALIDAVASCRQNGDPIMPKWGISDEEINDIQPDEVYTESSLTESNSNEDHGCSPGENSTDATHVPNSISPNMPDELTETFELLHIEQHVSGKCKENISSMAEVMLCAGVSCHVITVTYKLFDVLQVMEEFDLFYGNIEASMNPSTGKKYHSDINMKIECNKTPRTFAGKRLRT
jgi:hypothetical protein